MTDKARDALAAAMPSEGADAAIGYAAMKSERDELRAEVERLRKDAMDMKLALQEIEPHWTKWTDGRVWTAAAAGTAAFIRNVLDRAIAEGKP